MTGRLYVIFGVQQVFLGMVFKRKSWDLTAVIDIPLVAEEQMRLSLLFPPAAFHVSIWPTWWFWLCFHFCFVFLFLLTWSLGALRNGILDYRVVLLTDTLGSCTSWWFFFADFKTCLYEHMIHWRRRRGAGQEERRGEDTWRCCALEAVAAEEGLELKGGSVGTCANWGKGPPCRGCDQPEPSQGRRESSRAGHFGIGQLRVLLLVGSWRIG